MSWRDVALALGSVSLGALLGFGGTYLISWRDRTETRRRELAEAFGAFAAAAFKSRARLAEMPDPRASLVARNAYEANARLLGLGPMILEASHDVQSTYARLLFRKLTDEQRELVAEVMRYLDQLSSERNKEMDQRWTALHDRLKATAKDLAR